MKTKNTNEVNLGAIARILNAANWEYEGCVGESVRELDVQICISELGRGTITKNDIRNALLYVDLSEIDKEFKGVDFNTHIARHVADRVARNKVQVPYTSVTLYAIV